eukprot:Gregarina_sp_Poly_1__3350@NODE_1967_length_2975_cov_208_119326_g1267_i0_p2_GENE_NODE_1967_length_2975_cov_208_119326_g1267_i0NODE_1967_length_2975_cov_208_119326_g1267_i0_p2_ORF_typecomplete_len167_score20_80NPDC1/PF06809_11/0_004Phage_holin_3_6/PF07332_11/0_027Sugar_tr/PF00083_24/0_065DUF4203/PF13886_6/0_069YhfC/PF10086_9/0_091DUF2207/PF09972_9/0_12PLAC8/PF04749_17/0_22Frag1/PF10277_9/2_2_NODE_1967_length_2975_cov_208_119326_g1267_i024752918
MVQNPALASCAGFSIFAFITLVAFTIALKTHVMRLDKLPSTVRDNAASACLAAGLLYGCCAVICFYYLRRDTREARELEFLTRAEEKLEQQGSRMSKAGRKLAVRVRRDLADPSLADPLLEGQKKIVSLSQHLNQGSSGRGPRVVAV